MKFQKLNECSMRFPRIGSEIAYRLLCCQLLRN